MTAIVVIVALGAYAVLSEQADDRAEEARALEDRVESLETKNRRLEDLRQFPVTATTRSITSGGNVLLCVDWLESVGDARFACAGLTTRTIEACYHRARIGDRLPDCWRSLAEFRGAR